MRTPVSVGIVGYGYWGPNLARNLSSIAGARLSAVCYLDVERLGAVRQVHPDAAAFTACNRMLAEAELDAVVIATPPKSHHSLAKTCLFAGEHVLVEKPMACSSKECEELIKIAMQRGLTLIEGHTFLFSEVVAKIAEIVRSGDIGEIRCIDCRRLNSGGPSNGINAAWDLLTNICEHFLECIRDRRQPISSGAQGLEVVRILEAGDDSLRSNGGPVTIFGSRIVPLSPSIESWSEAS